MIRPVLLLAFIGLALGRSVLEEESLEDFLARHPFIHNRIVGGAEVVPHSRPYIVSLRLPSSNFHFCGGSILDEDTIMTAAHCVVGDSPSNVMVVAGEHKKSTPEGTEQAVGVSRITIHENYQSSTAFDNDIAILKLGTSLRFTDQVQAVPLPPNDTYTTGSEAEVIGWGALQSGGGSPDALYAVTVPIVTDESCRVSYGTSDITDSMICAGVVGKDSCQGDSGGPMTCQNDPVANRFVCGIVSWGRGCALAGYPGVYTEVWYFLNWIADNRN